MAYFEGWWATMIEYPFIELEDRICLPAILNHVGGIGDHPKCLGSRCSHFEGCLKDLMSATIETKKLVFEAQGLRKRPKPDHMCNCKFLKDPRNRAKFRGGD
jgi:hypothetical protein